LHIKVCNDISEWFKERYENSQIQICESCIKGQKGNKEFFIYVKI